MQTVTDFHCKLVGIVEKLKGTIHDMNHFVRT